MRFNKWWIRRKAIKQNNSVNETKQVKTNCNGCPNQDSCKYGFVIYDDIEHTRLTLAEKFIMLHTFDSFEPEGDYSDIATLEERHRGNLLMQMELDKLCRTLDYLEKQKSMYMSIGKCGRAYFNSMHIGDEINLLKNTIKCREKRK